LKVSVVIPTYNRGPKLRNTVTHLLQSDLAGLEQLEVIVVDDGSDEPASKALDELRVSPPIKLQCIRQSNRGAGPARNAGYRLATGEIVLFMDDDILPPPALLQQHVDSHRKQPGSVIFGNCPVIQPSPPTSMSRYVQKLWYSSLKPNSPEFLPWTACSGNLSIMKNDFAGWKDFYTEIAGGDDAELATRLTRSNIPQLLATRISAPQDQDLTIAKQYARMLHHAHGLALVAQCDRSSEELANTLQANGPLSRIDSVPRMVRKVALSVLSRFHLPSLLLRIVRLLESVRIPDMILHPCYGLLLNIAYFSGVRRAIASAKE
jgi:glycosyltransferase involved in cell wall biosynthesis